MTQSSICVVGLGVVSPLGNDPGTVFDRLMRGDTGIAMREFQAISPTAVAGVEFDASSRFSKTQLLGTDRVGQMALLAASYALEDAGITGFEDPARVGIYCGCGLGGIGSLVRSLELHASGRRPPPTTIPAVMPNGPASLIAIANQVRGPVLTYSVACASSAVAIIEAKRAIDRDEIDMAIVGGADAQLVEPVLAAWHSLQTLAAPGDMPERSCKPFGTDRSGFVLGEGAAFLVLERAEAAKKRERRIYARINGGGFSCDGVHLTKSNSEGQARALGLALKDARLTPSDIGYCNAHATATIAGDPSECEALRSTLGEHAAKVAVSSTKAAHGHLIAAAGAMEALITVVSLHRGKIPPTASTTNIAPECTGLMHVLGEGIDAPDLHCAVSNSFAFGGSNASIVFTKYRDFN